MPNRNPRPAYNEWISGFAFGALAMAGFVVALGLLR